MKIVFSDLPMKKELHAFKYAVDGNATIEYDEEVIFPVNSVLAKTMKKGEKVKVILLSKNDIEGNSSINAGYFQKELNKYANWDLRHQSFSRFCDTIDKKLEV